MTGATGRLKTTRIDLFWASPLYGESDKISGSSLTQRLTVSVLENTVSDEEKNQEMNGSEQAGDISPGLPDSNEPDVGEEETPEQESAGLEVTELARS